MTDHDIKAVQKILRHCDKLDKSVKRVGTYEGFLFDDDAVDAAVTRVGQIGELSHRELSSEFKMSLPCVPWVTIYGMRNHLIHGYDKIDLPMLWETITEDIPDIAVVLRKRLEEYEKPFGVKQMRLDQIHIKWGRTGFDKVH